MDLPAPVHELRARASQARDRGQRASTAAWDCRLEAVRRSFRCSEDDDGFVFLAPFPPSSRDENDWGYVTDRSGERNLFGFKYEWMPINLVSGGEAAFTLWTGNADRNVVERCDSIDECRKYFNFGGPYGARIVTLCTVERFAARIGPPKDCVPLVLQIESERFIRVIVGFNMIPGGSPPGDRVFSVRFQRSPAVSRAVVLDAITRSLARPPFSLATERGSARIRGTAGPRESMILSPWREELSLRVNVEEGFSGELGRFMGIEVDLTLWVHRRLVATGMHQPTPQQEQRYTNAVLAAVKTALRTLCTTTPAERDSRTVVCNR